MRQIKFRGRTFNGKFVFGDLIHMTGGRIGIIFDKRVAAVEVVPDSVAQLVGHDVNGNEVYEGDVLLDSNGVEYTARLESIHQDELGRFSFWEYPSQLTLKEAQA